MQRLCHAESSVHRNLYLALVRDHQVSISNARAMVWKLESNGFLEIPLYEWLSPTFKISFSFALFFHFNFISPNESFQQHCFKIRYSLHLNEAQSKAELLYIMAPKKEHSLSVEDVHHGPSSQALSQYSRQEAALTPVQPRGRGRRHTSSQWPSSHIARCCPNLGPGDVYTAIQLLPHSRSGVSDPRESCR